MFFVLIKTDRLIKKLLFFTQGLPYQLDAIKQDFEKTGKCNFQLARDSFSTLPVAMALPKHSPYTNPISKRYDIFIYWMLPGLWRALYWNFGSITASWNYRKADWSTTGICGSVQCRFNVWKISNRVDWNLQGVKSICRCLLRIWLAPFLSFRLASASPSWLFFASELFQWLDVNGLADAFNCILYTNNDVVLGIIEILPRTSIFWLNSRFIVNPL